MLLSIIIPVYNVEKYIVNCLESIYNQGADSRQFQVIIVNDGTKDNSIDLIKYYIDKKDNCTLINQQNQGLSVARNTGLKASLGKYVWFVDSDDEVVPGSLIPILDLLEKRNEDVIAYSVYIKDETTGKKRIEKPFNKNHSDDFFNNSYLGKQVLGQFYKGLVQRYMLRRAFLIENQLCFYQKIWYEDDQLLVRLFCYYENIFVSSICSYCYLQRQSGSIMSTISIRSVSDSFKIINSWEQFMNEKSIHGLNRQWVNYNIYKYYYYILSLACAEIEEYPNYMKGQKIYTKKQMIKYLFLSGNFVSLKALLRTVAMCVSPCLLNINKRKSRYLLEK